MKRVNQEGGEKEGERERAREHKGVKAKMVG